MDGLARCPIKVPFYTSLAAGPLQTFLVLLAILFKDHTDTVRDPNDKYVEVVLYSKVQKSLCESFVEKLSVFCNL